VIEGPFRNFRPLAAAFSYFSILPIPHSDEPPSEDAIALLPLVGVIIGVFAGLGGYGSWLLTQSSIAAAIVAWVLSIALSGAIHVDGFLDCCDGLFATASPQRRLEIMRDPRHGTYAIVGMAMISMLWLYALAQIPAVLLLVVLPLAAIFARCGALLVRRPSVIVLGAVAGVLAAIDAPSHRFGVLGAVVLAILVAAAVEAFARRRLGGMLSGDCYGAAIVVTEVALLLAFPALLRLR